MHGDFNIPIMSGTLTSRNSSMNSVVYGGVQQQIRNVPSGRFASNNIHVGLSQISHGSSHGEYSRVANRGGLGVSPFLGSASLRATSSMGNIVGSGNIGMSIGSGGGLYVPGLASHLNMSANNGSGSLGVQGPSRLNNGVLQQGSMHPNVMVGPVIPATPCSHATRSVYSTCT